MLPGSDDRDDDGRLRETDPLEEFTDPRCSMLLRLDLDLSRGTRSIPMACTLVRTVLQRLLDDDVRAGEIERAFRERASLVIAQRPTGNDCRLVVELFIDRLSVQVVDQCRGLVSAAVPGWEEDQTDSWLETLRPLNPSRERAWRLYRS